MKYKFKEKKLAESSRVKCRVCDWIARKSEKQVDCWFEVSCDGEFRSSQVDGQSRQIVGFFLFHIKNKWKINWNESSYHSWIEASIAYAQMFFYIYIGLGEDDYELIQLYLIYIV